MVFNIIPSIGGLFKFFKRYGGIIDVEEAIRIFNGFFTGTTGVYNPVFSGFRSKKVKAPWRNTKESPYKQEKFEIQIIRKLNVFSTKSKNKTFRLPIVKDFDLITQNSFNILYNRIYDIKTALNITKSCDYRQKIVKLHIITDNITNYIQTININTILETKNYTPIIIGTWLVSKITSQLGVLTWLKSKITNRLEDGSFILDDVGTISDIERIEIIKQIEMVEMLNARGY